MDPENGQIKIFEKQIQQLKQKKVDEIYLKKFETHLEKIKKIRDFV